MTKRHYAFMGQYLTNRMNYLTMITALSIFYSFSGSADETPSWRFNDTQTTVIYTGAKRQFSKGTSAWRSTFSQTAGISSFLL